MAAQKSKKGARSKATGLDRTEAHTRNRWKRTGALDKPVGLFSTKPRVRRTPVKYGKI